MRVLNFYDGQSSGTTPNIFFTPVGKAAGYANDAAYEAAISPETPAGGEFYYNTTDKMLRVYKAGIGWENVGDQVIGVQEVPVGLVNSLNVDYDVTSVPVNDEALNVFINGREINKSLYSFSSPTITFTTAPSIGQEVYVSYLTEGIQAVQTIVDGTPNVVYHTVTSGEITAKALTLPTTPATVTHVMVDHIGGTSQVYGSDYNVSGTTLNWNGLGMESFLIAGEVLRINYLS